MLKLLGHFGVDSGQVMIVDPCYISGSWTDGSPAPQDFTPGKNLDFSFTGACNATLSGDHGGELKHNGVREYAVVSSTGFGDGVYPVYAEIKNIPGWGERVVRLIVDFKCEDEDEDEENED